MGGCSKNNDKKDGKDGAKDGSNKANTGLFLKRDTSAGFQISLEKKVFHCSLSRDTEFGELSDESLKEHLIYLDDLAQQGKLESCGAYSSDNGGYQVIIASSEDEVRDILATDPLMKAGYYAKTTIEQIQKSDMTNLVASLEAKDCKM